MQRDIIREALSIAGFEVDTAPDVASAKKLLKSRPYDVLVTDIRLGEQNGLELARFAKALDHTIEVIVITGYASVETALEAIRAETFDYLQKPLDLNELMRVVERACARAKAARRSKKALEELIESGKIAPLFTKPKDIAPGEAKITHLEGGKGEAGAMDRIRNKLQTLKLLWELKESGAITQEEYEKLKKKILEGDL